MARRNDTEYHLDGVADDLSAAAWGAKRLPQNADTKRLVAAIDEALVMADALAARLGNDTTLG